MLVRRCLWGLILTPQNNFRCWCVGVHRDVFFIFVTTPTHRSDRLLVDGKTVYDDCIGEDTGLCTHLRRRVEAHLEPTS